MIDLNDIGITLKSEEVGYLINGAFSEWDLSDSEIDRAIANIDYSKVEVAARKLVDPQDRRNAVVDEIIKQVYDLV